MKYEGRAELCDNWWAIVVNANGRDIHTQARSEDEIDKMAREAVALTLGVPEDSFTLNVTRDIGYDIDLNTEVILDGDGRRIDQAYVDEVVEAAHRQLGSRRGEAQE